MPREADHLRARRRREYLDAYLALDNMIGRKPWETSIMDCIDVDSKPDYESDENNCGARAILTALEQAAGRR